MFARALLPYDTFTRGVYLLAYVFPPTYRTAAMRRGYYHTYTVNLHRNPHRPFIAVLRRCRLPGLLPGMPLAHCGTYLIPGTRAARLPDPGIQRFRTQFTHSKSSRGGRWTPPHRPG